MNTIEAMGKELIRVRDIFNEHETIAALESIITDNLGTLSEIQQLLSPEGVN